MWKKYNKECNGNNVKQKVCLNMWKHLNNHSRTLKSYWYCYNINYKLFDIFCSISINCITHAKWRNMHPYSYEQSQFLRKWYGGLHRAWVYFRRLRENRIKINATFITNDTVISNHFPPISDTSMRFRTLPFHLKSAVSDFGRYLPFTSTIFRSRILSSDYVRNRPISDGISVRS